jgi:hypothetical protein
MSNIRIETLRKEQRERERERERNEIRTPKKHTYHPEKRILIISSTSTLQ